MLLQQLQNANIKRDTVIDARARKSRQFYKLKFIKSLDFYYYLCYYKFYFSIYTFKD